MAVLATSGFSTPITILAAGAIFALAEMLGAVPADSSEIKNAPPGARSTAAARGGSMQRIQHLRREIASFHSSRLEQPIPALTCL